MPGSILRRALGAALLGAALGLLGTQVGAAGGTAQVSTEIPAGKTKTVRLRNLPRGTDVTVRVDAAGKLGVALVSRAQLKLRSPQALFKGALDRRMTFRVTIPEPDHYYLVLDNRRGAESIKAQVTIRAQRDADPSSAPLPAVPGGRAL